MSTAPRDQSKLFWNAGWVVPEQTPRPRERLWTLRQGERVIEAALIVFDDGAPEVQLFVNGELFKARRCHPLPLARHYARTVYGDYVALGWA